MAKVEETMNVIFTGLQLMAYLTETMRLYNAGKLSDEEAFERMKTAGPGWKAISEAPWDNPKQ